LSTTIAWESGLTCEADGCGQEIVIGEEFLFWYGRKMHPRCAARDAASRREAAEEDPDVLKVAQRLLESRARVILTRRQIRALIVLACASDSFIPVRRPDAGGRHQWHGRLAGWSAARVKAGLSAPEVAGMWLDFLDAGRTPPLRQSDLAALVSAICPAVTPALSLPGRDLCSYRTRDPGAEGTGKR
jgi:hypothetical protein